MWIGVLLYRRWVRLRKGGTWVYLPPRNPSSCSPQSAIEHDCYKNPLLFIREQHSEGFWGHSCFGFPAYSFKELPRKSKIRLASIKCIKLTSLWIQKISLFPSYSYLTYWNLIIHIRCSSLRWAWIPNVSFGSHISVIAWAPHLIVCESAVPSFGVSSHMGIVVWASHYIEWMFKGVCIFCTTWPLNASLLHYLVFS